MAENTTALSALLGSVDYSEVFNPTNYRSFASNGEEAQTFSNDAEHLVTGQDIDVEQAAWQEVNRGRLRTQRLVDRARFQRDYDFNQAQMAKEGVTPEELADLEHQNRGLLYKIGEIDRIMSRKDTGIKHMVKLLDRLSDKVRRDAIVQGMKDYLTNYVATGNIGPCTVTFMGEEYSYSE
ncbi:hypothetical protein FUAX_35020 [Fulvitalea axinellae]|uniref:Uncharacterized protein n=1 Tax=Fulvitalea axinellae TaxID=1182444 RepID=A0AAU9DEZ1_9BACT|nr:hypothetical protein FUAX_35020 [Fulvitalea axinellae]